MATYSVRTNVLTIFPINTRDPHGWLQPKYSTIRTLSIPGGLDDGDVRDLLAELRRFADAQRHGAPGAQPASTASGVETFFDELLEVLPPGFIHDPAYGLGLLQECNRLIRLIEKHTSCEEIAFSPYNDQFGADGRTFHLAVNRFGDIWTELKRITSRGNSAATRVQNS